MKSTVLTVKLFVAILICLISCQKRKSIEKKVSVPFETVCTNFLNAIYEKNFFEAKLKMDVDFLPSDKRLKLDSAFNILSVQLNEEFQAPISITGVTSEKTFNGNLPVTFVILKITSKQNFGYYSFYVNDENGRITLLSRLGDTKKSR